MYLHIFHHQLTISWSKKLKYNMMMTIYVWYNRSWLIIILASSLGSIYRFDHDGTSRHIYICIRTLYIFWWSNKWFLYLILSYKSTLLYQIYFSYCRLMISLKTILKLYHHFSDRHQVYVYNIHISISIYTHQYINIFNK